MFAQRASRVWLVSVVAGLLLLGVPGTASAAAPQCTPEPSLYQLPAGLTWLNPRAPCTDEDGDPITVDVRAVINGVEHFRLADGPHAGKWVGYSKVRRLASLKRW